MTAQLNIGDRIGFTFLAQDVDSNDRVIFFPVIAIGERDGETAYFVQFPDGEISRAGIRHSDLGAYVIERQPQVNPKMICLSERKKEFTEAMERGKNNRLEVYADWDKDAFVVVNLDNQAEYRVKLESHNNQLFADCECPDFVYRKRICKHVSSVLVDALFNSSVKA